MKRKTELLLICAISAVLFACMSVTVFADENWSNLQTRLNQGGEIVLDQDYTADASDVALEVPEGATVILDLNGHTIDRGLTEKNAKVNGSVITVKGSLTIKDSDP
ncbi:MAG: hypothetical protein IJ128_03185, partial [Firmicutes bacterium]|nr:hypothetical protein [Bacillota bacterium]